MTKADIIEKGANLGVDYGLTSSCYDPQKMVIHVVIVMPAYCVKGIQGSMHS
ncbi:MAG: hypothetical protein Ct9H300mP9_0360 [Candidatus Neomarinimicrobiota bacterium]|nr:MAG: hypothetical protein Ct9H300mP9_0360 [Candidatus Neomarinimicrobiota bacterium]